MGNSLLRSVARRTRPPTASSLAELPCRRGLPSAADPWSAWCPVPLEGSEGSLTAADSLSPKRIAAAAAAGADVDAQHSRKLAQGGIAGRASPGWKAAAGRPRRGRTGEAELERGCTPLCTAAVAGRADCVLELLQCGADPSVRSSAGASPLHYATACGHAEVVEALLRGRSPWEVECMVKVPRDGFHVWSDDEHAATPLQLALLAPAGRARPTLEAMSAGLVDTGGAATPSFCRHSSLSPELLKQRSKWPTSARPGRRPEPRMLRRAVLPALLDAGLRGGADNLDPRPRPSKRAPKKPGGEAPAAGQRGPRLRQLRPHEGLQRHPADARGARWQSPARTAAPRARRRRRRHDLANRRRASAAREPVPVRLQPLQAAAGGGRDQSRRFRK